MKNYYEILEINKDATPKEIKKAFYALAKKYHPDTTHFDKEYGQEKFKEIEHAYKILSNPQTKSTYDNSLKNQYEEQERLRKEAEAKAREYRRRQADAEEQERQRKIWEEIQRQRKQEEFERQRKLWEQRVEEERKRYQEEEFERQRREWEEIQCQRKQEAENNSKNTSSDTISEDNVSGSTFNFRKVLSFKETIFLIILCIFIVAAIYDNREVDKKVDPSKTTISSSIGGNNDKDNIQENKLSKNILDDSKINKPSDKNNDSNTMVNKTSSDKKIVTKVTKEVKPPPLSSLNKRIRKTNYRKFKTKFNTVEFNIKGPFAFHDDTSDEFDCYISLLHNSKGYLLLSVEFDVDVYLYLPHTSEYYFIGTYHSSFDCYKEGFYKTPLRENLYAHLERTFLSKNFRKDFSEHLKKYKTWLFYYDFHNVKTVTREQYSKTSIVSEYK